MSFAATFDTFANVRTIPPGARLVLAAISTFTNKQGTCFPSLKAIAERTSLTVRSVQRHLASLISLGFIERTYRAGRSALTRINLARLSPATTTGGGDRNDMGGGDKNDTQNLSFEPINTRTAAPASPPPDTANAAIVVFTENEQPITPQALTKEMPDVFATDSMVTVSEVTGCHPQAGMPVEARTAPQEPSKEVPATDTLADVPAQAVEADPLAEVPATLLADLGEVRKAKKRAPKPTKTEAALWWQEAQKAGWTMQQVITTMILHGWARFQADWVQHVPQTAPAAPKIWEPTPHQPVNANTLAAMKEKIRQMKERWAAEKLAQTATAPPMRQ